MRWFFRFCKIGTLGAAAAVFAAGCVAKNWSYAPAGGATPEKTSVQVAIIAPFQEARPPAARESNSALWLVPLIPYSRFTSYYPETRGGAGTRADYTPGEAPPRERELEEAAQKVTEAEQKQKLQDELNALRKARLGEWDLRKGDDLKSVVAGALADELKASGAVEDVFLASSREGERKADLYIAGTLDLVEERRATLSYGLTIAAPALWLFLPATTTGYRLAYTLEVQDAQGRILQRQTYRTAESPSADWIYTSAWGAMYARHLPELARSLNARAVEDFQALLKSYPKEYWGALSKLRESEKARF